MIFPVVFSTRARRNLGSIEKYLAERFSPQNAEIYMQRLAAACVNIGSAPFRGSRQEQIGANVRTVGFERRATILFLIEPDRVVILSVLFAGKSPDPDLLG